MDKKGKKIHPFEHARLRPDMYIGSVSTKIDKRWVVQIKDDVTKIVKKNINYNHGLERIIIEILSNAIDNKWRSIENDITMKKIDMTFNKNSGEICVINDGYFIPVEKTEYTFKDFRTKKETTEELYPAELFFGEMNTSTNYNDKEKRKTSGRNGMGAKAANVYSKKFEVEHVDPEKRKKFYQEYSNGGLEREDPVITSSSLKRGYTKITFTPDYKYFKYPIHKQEYCDDLLSLIHKHMYDCSMITGFKTNFTVIDEEESEKFPISIKDLANYVKFFNIENFIYLKSPNGNECVITEIPEPEKDQEDSVNNISFINGINTRDGGLHVDAFIDSIFPRLVKAFNSRKGKNLRTTAKEIYPYFLLFVRCEADNPKFDSQSKERFTELRDEDDEVVDFTLFDKKSKKEKDEWTTLVNNSIKKILKWSFITHLEDKLLAKADRANMRKENVKKKIIADDSLRDANFAGHATLADDAFLFLTEGKSAKSLADAGAKSVEGGTDRFGSFAIRGKFINIIRNSQEKIRNNKEVQILKQVLNLRTGVDYSIEENFKTLRYRGGVVAFADADDDGIHINGLLALFFYKFWPSLYNRGFVKKMSTAVIKLIPKNKKVEEKFFYSIPEYEKFMKDKDARTVSRNYEVKYLKGLGSHKNEDARFYFENPKFISFTMNDLDEKENEMIEIAFSNKDLDEKKSWIISHLKNKEPKNTKCKLVDLPENIPSEKEREKTMYQYKGDMSLFNFIDTQLIRYQRITLFRSIPNMYDSFKDGQRKIYYTISRKNLTKTICVENLAGSVKELTEYDHGGQSVQETIIKMAQGFVGSKNLPLLVCDGAFGTRFEGGNDHAAGRYVSTKFENITGYIFRNEDDPILPKKYNREGYQVENEFYIPIIPLVLFNGTMGISCGFSSKIPCYNPIDVVEFIRHFIKNGKFPKNKRLIPWYRGFKGEIELVEGSDNNPVAWTCRGILEKSKKKGWWSITEAPIEIWTNKIKSHLEFLMTGVNTNSKTKKKSESYLADFNEYGTINTIHFEIKPKKNFIPDIDTKGNFNILKNKHSLKNIVVLDENGYPRRYSTPENLLYDFCKKRLEFYGIRKKYWLDVYNQQLKKERNRLKFVKSVNEKKLIMNQEDSDVEKDMLELGLQKIDESFDYLLSMQMRSMTVKKIEEIKKEIEKIKNKIKELEDKEPEQIWSEELDEFVNAYEIFLKTRNDDTIVKKTKK